VKSLIAFIVLTLTAHCFSQELAILSKNADVFYGIDDFNSLYYGKEEALFKTDARGTYRFYDIQLGAITTIDLINPLKILLFYEETQTAILLDNRLNELERIDLYQLQPYRYIDYVSLAGERRFWMHNQDENTVELYDYIDNRLIVRTPILKGKVNKLLTDYNFCHALIGDEIITYNTYGSKTSILSLDSFGGMDYDFETLAVIGDKTVATYRFDREFRFRESETFILPESIPAVERAYLKAGKLYLWDGLKIHTLSIKPNKN
jgi:hypothetical protein